MNEPLDESSDQILNEMFAIEVAGWTRGNVSNKFSPQFGNVVFWPSKTNRKKWPLGICVPKFTDDANLVLPFLDECACKIVRRCWEDGFPDAWDIQVDDGSPKGVGVASDAKFGRASIIALIRASRAKRLGTL